MLTWERKAYLGHKRVRQAYFTPSAEEIMLQPKGRPVLEHPKRAAAFHSSAVPFARLYIYNIFISYEYIQYMLFITTCQFNLLFFKKS